MIIFIILFSPYFFTAHLVSFALQKKDDSVKDSEDFKTA